MSWKEGAQNWIEELNMKKDILDDDISEIEDAIEANDKESFFTIIQAYEEE